MQIIEISPERMSGKLKFPLKIIKGSALCGGCVRDWFLGRKPSDYDVFFESEACLAEFAEENKLIKPVFETSNAGTYNVGGIKVQLVKKVFGGSSPSDSNFISNLFSFFDFNICMFAHDGEKIYSTPEAIIDCLRGRLTVNKISGEFCVDSLRRAFKYQEQGFKPCMGTISELSKAIGDYAAEKGVELLANQAEISPNGGRRTIRFD